MKVINSILFTSGILLCLTSCNYNSKTEEEKGSNSDSLLAKQLYSSGIEKQNAEKYAEAISDFTKITALNSFYLKAAYYNRGYCKGHLYDIRGAIEDYDKVIAIDTTWSEVYMRRAFAKFELDDKEGGCLDLSKGGELGDTLAYMFMKEKCYDK